jgi:hypothetical protein
VILLTATTDTLELTTSAAATLDVHASYMDAPNPITTSSSMTAGRQHTAITTATTTTVLSAPGASTVRNVKTLNIRNKHVSTSTDVTVTFDQNATNYELVKVTLRAGETLEYVEGVGFFTVAPASAPARSYSTADQVANAADTYITGSMIPIPSGRALAVGTILIWKFSITKTGASTATPIWSVRFGSGVIGDTARLSFTGPAQTGVIDTATVEIVATIRSIGGSGVATGSIDLHHALSATGFANVAHHVGTNTSGAFDTTTVTGVGVSVNPGSAGVWTFTQATGEVANL